MVICNEGIDRYDEMNHVSKVKKQMIPMMILNLMTKLRCLSLGHPHTCYLCCQMVTPIICQDARCRDGLELVLNIVYILLLIPGPGKSVAAAGYARIVRFSSKCYPIR
jgi:hypothetical protein